MQTPTEIEKGVLEYIASDSNEIALILLKLEKDEYVMKSIGNEFDSANKVIQVYKYAITFDGKVFLKQGGYNLREVRFSEQSKKAEILTSTQMEIQTSVGRLTFWIAVGAIIASGYYLYYLIIPIYDHFFLKK